MNKSILIERYIEILSILIERLNFSSEMLSRLSRSVTQSLGRSSLKSGRISIGEGHIDTLSFVRALSTSELLNDLGKENFAN